MSKNLSNNPETPSQSQPQPQPPSTPVAKAQITAKFSGPLPPPNILVGYNAIVPGAAERIIAMAENDARHLQAMERTSVEGAFAERRLGQKFGLCIGLAALAGSVFLGYTGHDWTAGILGGTTVVGLVTVFVVGRVTRSS